MNLDELFEKEISNTKELDVFGEQFKLTEYVRANYEKLVNDYFVRLVKRGVKPYEFLVDVLRDNNIGNYSINSIANTFSTVKKERELQGIKTDKKSVPSKKDLFYKNQEKLNQLARLDNSTLNSSLQSQNNNMVKGVTPTLEIQPGEEVVAPQSMAMPESKAGEMVELSQVEGKPPSIRMSREESIHMEIPPGLTAQEGEMLKKWYDISWIGDEPDWSVVLKEEYLSKLNMETWDDEKENIWRHIFKLCREKYGMTESEMTTATYFERKATKDIATLRSKLAFIRARKATKYQLNIYTIGKKTRKSS